MPGNDSYQHEIRCNTFFPVQKNTVMLSEINKLYQATSYKMHLWYQNINIVGGGRYKRGHSN